MKNRDFIVLSVLTLATVILWTVFEVVHTLQKSTITPIVQTQIKPIAPNFDIKILKDLKSRQNQ